QGVLQHQELRLDVLAGRPGGARQPGLADLDPPMLWTQSEEAGAAEHAAPFLVGGHEGSLALGRGFAKGMREPAIEALRLAAVDLHPTPDDRVGRDPSQRLPVLITNRLERDQPAVE